MVTMKMRGSPPIFRPLSIRAPAVICLLSSGMDSAPYVAVTFFIQIGMPSIRSPMPGMGGNG